MARVTEEMRLVSGGFRMAYKHWRPAGGAAATQRMLCYPGWLDNAGSFDNIAPLLVQQGWELVCPDPPGCGYSQHHPPYGTYNDFEEVPFVLGLVEELGWTTGPQFTACGHSRGGGLMLAFAAAFPEYVNALVVIENSFIAPIGAFPWTFGKTPAQAMRDAVKYDKQNGGRAPRIFDTFAEVVDASENNKLFKKSRSTATNITRRQVKQLDDGRWQYTHDVLHYGQRQKIYPSAQMMESWAESVQCPVLLMRSDYNTIPLPSRLVKPLEARKLKFKSLVDKKVHGDHHLHSDIPEVAFAAMKDFLEQATASGTMCRKAKL
eukprot:TRINITY_DN5652_c0_g1_i5.p1 TRINITY_DN5652_c0_g1~~TRINITY_DN5652_c0_g1_i5.p1  ORF type:complete len:352 (+),score=119.98 TRINITY_DN5652_c0_g1_i5:98-1057(+)